MTVERLEKYLKVKKIVTRQFELACGMSNGYFAKQVKAKGSIGSDFLERVAEAYPDLNITWLITGKGPMIVKPPTTTKADEEENHVLQEERAVYEKTSELMDDFQKRWKDIKGMKGKINKKKG